MNAVHNPSIKEENISDIFYPLMGNDTLSHASSSLVRPNPTTQMLLTSKPPIHTPESGLNPLVDSAAYLFSLMGKLKLLKQCKNFSKLQTELIQEIENFQETLSSCHYNNERLNEYIPISCYALCMTFDDIISNTPWGQTQWDDYNLITAYKQDALTHESFLIILERFVRDPAIYIDAMEFIYICLNLGLSFKGRQQNPDLGQEQLHQISYSLYKRIRAYRGTFNKVLSPFSIKPPRKLSLKSRLLSLPSWCVLLFSTLSFMLVLGIGKLFIDHLATKLEFSTYESTHKQN